MSLTPEQLQAIRERAEKATPGPWEWRIKKPNADGHITIGDLSHRRNEKQSTIVLCVRPNKYGIDEICAWNESNIEVIAHARTDIPMLLDALEQAQAERDQLKKGGVKLLDKYVDLQYENQRLQQEIERLNQNQIKLWDCPECGFSFDAIHTNADGGGYSCPNCAESRLAQENERYKQALEEVKQILLWGNAESACLKASEIVEKALQASGVDV